MAVAFGIGAAVFAGWGGGIAWADDAGGSSATADTATSTESAADSPTDTEKSDDDAEPDTTKPDAEPEESAEDHDEVARSAPLAVDDDTGDLPTPIPASTPSTRDTSDDDDVEPSNPKPIPAVSVSSTGANLAEVGATDSPQAPAAATTAWAVPGSSRREFDPDVESSAQADSAASSVHNSLSYTAPPTLRDRLTLMGLRVARDVFAAFGVDLAGTLATLLSSEDPPFFVKYGLNARQSQREVSPGNVWKVWEFEPEDPSGKTVIGIHGGGHVRHPTLLHWIDYTRMARETGATVVVPMYPLATTPTGSLRNVIPAMADFISHEIGDHTAENVSVYADSAGCTYAFAALRELILRGDALPASIVLISGVADASLTNPAIRTVDDPFLNPDSLQLWTTDSHAYDGITDLTNPMVSPLYLETDVLAALPPTTIYVGTEEMLLPDNLLLHRRAVDVGAPISIVLGQGQFHDWAISGLAINSAAPRIRPDVYRRLGLFELGPRTLILSAFPAEADAVLARTTLDRNSTVVVDGHHFYLGTLGGKKVLLAMTGIGMVNATRTTEVALDYFTPESGISVGAVVFSGVAGGSGRTEIGSVAIPARWTTDDGQTWQAVDGDMLAVANTLDVDLRSSGSIGDPACYCGLLTGPQVDLGREPSLFVGGDGSSDDFNNGTAFPAIPLGGDIFGPRPCAAPDFSILATGNFFQALAPFLAFGLLSNLGFLTDVPPAVDAVDQETAAAQLVALAHGVPFLGIRGTSDGPGDPLRLPGYPFTFFVYKQIASENAAIVTEAFLQSWSGA